MESDGRITFAELASMYDIINGTVFTILTEYFDMRRVSAYWIPRLLADNDKAKQVQLSTAFLRQ